MAKPDSSPRDRIFFFDAAPHACIVLGQDLRVRDVNYAFSSVTGWQLDEVLLRSAKDLMGDEAAKRLAAALDADWQSVASVKAGVRCKDGRTVELEWHVRALPEREKVYCIASFVPATGALAKVPEALPLPLVTTRRATPTWARRQAPL